jgi:hypothetical protein
VREIIMRFLTWGIVLPILIARSVDGFWTVYDFYPVFAIAITLLAGLLIAGVLVYLRRIIIGPRISFRKCGQCGYDLTENVSGRCPECGTSVSGPPPKVD